MIRDTNIIIVLVMLLFPGCSDKPFGRLDENKGEILRHDTTSLKSDKNVEELNNLANDQNAGREARCEAVFTLFANHVKPGYGPSETAKVLLDTNWLDESKLLGIYLLGVDTLIRQGYEETQFLIRLFPNEDDWSDCVIYLTLSGKPDREEDEAIDFLKGKSDIEGDPAIVEFSLCFPNGMIERFDSKGMKSFEPERNLEVLEFLFREAISSRQGALVWFMDYAPPGSSKDPPLAFLKRFSDLSVSIKKVSEAITDYQQSVWDPETGEQGWIVYAVIDRWIDDRTVQVEYGDYHGMLAGCMIRGKLKYKDGKWTLGQAEITEW